MQEFIVHMFVTFVLDKLSESFVYFKTMPIVLFISVDTFCTHFPTNHFLQQKNWCHQQNSMDFNNCEENIA